MYYGLLAFPFLVFVVPVLGGALHHAKATAYDKSGMLVAKLDAKQLRKKVLSDSKLKEQPLTEAQIEARMRRHSTIARRRHSHSGTSRESSSTHGKGSNIDRCTKRSRASSSAQGKGSNIDRSRQSEGNGRTQQTLAAKKIQHAAHSKSQKRLLSNYFPEQTPLQLL